MVVKIISQDTHNEVKRAKHAIASCKVFHDTYKPDIRSNLMSGKIEGRKQKMINGFVRKEEFHKLTEPEAKAFILFLIMEAERHKEDIETIESDILEVRRIQRNKEKEEKTKNG